MKPKIAFVCPRSPRESYAGIENYVINLAKEIKKDYEVEIYCTAEKPKNNAKINGIRIKEFKEDKIPFGIHYYSRQLIKSLKDSNAEILHAAGYNTLSPLIAMKGKRKNQRLVVTLGSSKSSSLLRKAFEIPYGLILRVMSRKVDYFIALSKFEKNEFLKKFPSNRFEVIPIAHEYSKKELEKNLTKKRKKQVVSVGRLVKNKGFHHVLNAFAELVKLDSDFRLVIIGDGDYRNGLERKAKGLGVKSKVKFTRSIGYKNHSKVMDYLKESSAFVFLSNYESQGVVVEEAICSGTPTIVSNKTAIKEFADCGLAYSFEQTDSKKIAEKIIEVSKNPKRYTAKQNQIDKCYLIKDWKTVAEETKNIYKKILR